MAAVLDHVAIATRDPEKLKTILKLIGLTDGGDENLPTQGLKVHFLQIQDSAPSVEILEVIDPTSTVEKYLAKKGPGIHHLSFLVPDIRSMMDHLTKNNVRLVYDKPRPGAHHTQVNFIHPESTGGILIEIAQKS